MHDSVYSIPSSFTRVNTIFQNLRHSSPLRPFYLPHKYIISTSYYYKIIIINNKAKKMPIFWSRNKSEIDAKIVTGKQN